jgi:uncharacterized lipoprotein YehR (DUF1307 family)
MKKALIAALLVVTLVITGCGSDNGSTMSKTCTMTETDEDGFIQESIVTLRYGDDNYIDVMESINKMETDPEYIDYAYGMFVTFTGVYSDIEGIDSSAEIDGNTIIFNMDIDFNNIDIKAYNAAMADEYGDDDDDDFFTDETNTKVDVDEYIESELEGYTCK